MGAFDISCSVNRKNTGVGHLCQDIGAITGYAITPYDFSMTAADAALEAKWILKLQAAASDRIYPFPAVFTHTDNSEDTVFEEGPIGNLFVRDGKINFTFTHESSRYKHEALKSHSLQKVGVVFFTSVSGSYKIHGVRNGETFEAIKLQQFVVGRLNINDGAGAATKTSVTMILADTAKFESLPAVVSVDWSPIDLEGLRDVNLTLLTSSSSVQTVQFAIDKSGEAYNPIDDDIVVKNAAGAVQTFTTAVSVAGVMTITFAAPLSAGVYTIDMLPTETVGITPGYESTGSVTFTIAP